MLREALNSWGRFTMSKKLNKVDALSFDVEDLIESDVLPRLSQWTVILRNKEKFTLYAQIHFIFANEYQIEYKAVEPDGGLIIRHTNLSKVRKALLGYLK